MKSREKHSKSKMDPNVPATAPIKVEGEASRDLLRRLTLAPGAPGAEEAVRRIVREALEGAGDISYDRLGSILCEKVGASASPRVVLDAHLDEVAFLVQSI